MSITLNFSSFVPSFLNMAGQMGIFRANGRLGFWDSDNSISWSSLYDLTDFTPAVETLAGNSTFLSVVGRIVNILPQGEGFIIYATKSIVGVRSSKANVNILWEANQITAEAGIVYPFQVTTGLTELEHYAFTNTGIKRIGDYNALKQSHTIEEIATEIFDFLKESKEPVRLDFLGGRFLFFSLINDNYINGRVLNKIDVANSYIVRISSGGGASDINVNDEYIGGKTYLSTIKESIVANNKEGMFLWWEATAQAMIPNRISPVNPYRLDKYYKLIPNTPPSYDTSSLLSADDVRALVEGGVYVQPAPKAVDMNNGSKLGITYYSSLAGGVAYLGHTDKGLNAAFEAQQEEWAMYSLIQQNTLAALQAAPTITGIKIQGITPYETIKKANDILELSIQADLAAHPGATRNGNTVTWYEFAGILPSGNVNVDAPEFPDIGRRFASASMTAHFYGGYRIKRKVSRTYTAVPRNAYPLYRARISVSDYIYDALPFSSTQYDENGRIIFKPRESLDDNTDFFGYSTVGFREALQRLFGYIYGSVFKEYWSDDHENYYYNGHFSGLTQWPDIVAYNPVSNQMESSGGSVTFPTSFVWSRIRYYNGSFIGDPADWSGIFYNISFIILAEHFYYIDHQDTYSLELEYDPSLEVFDSTMTASQTDLSWGSYTDAMEIPKTFRWTDGEIHIPGYQLAGYKVPPLDITYPGASFLLQDGIPAPIYPIYKGALVLDLALKKWGKLKADYTALVDYSPINTIQYTIPYSNFGLDMGILDANGKLFLADAKPSDSYILYGKFGYYRLGMTKLEEFKANFRLPFTGNIEIASSMDGKNLQTGLVSTYSFNNTNQATAYCNQSGRWHVVKISGIYDLCYLEMRGNIKGRR